MAEAEISDFYRCIVNGFWKFSEHDGCLYGNIGRCRLTLADSLAFVCQGIAPASGNTGMESFVMPVTWLLFMMLQLLIPLDHPVHSMELWGSQYLVRTGRRSWWLSKSIYTLAVNLLSFGIYLCTAILFCAAHSISLTMDGNAGFYKTAVWRGGFK